MPAQTLTISLPEDLLKFLQENKGLSASKVMQSALLNIQDSIKWNPGLVEAHKKIKKLENFILELQEHLQKATEFITIKGLWEEYDGKQ